MNPRFPEVLRELLAATDAPDRERAWGAFLVEYSDVVMGVARRMGGSHDVVMDRYTFVLEALSRDGHHRLRTYLADGAGHFTSWLSVVVRRLCHDEHRRRYGRLQGESVVSAEQHAARRSLVDLIGNELDVDALAVAGGHDPDLDLRRSELKAALADALAELPVSDRLVLRLRFEDGLSVPEIARATSAGSPFRLYRRINRLLEGLKSALLRAGVDDAAP